MSYVNSARILVRSSIAGYMLSLIISLVIYFSSYALLIAFVVFWFGGGLLTLSACYVWCTFCRKSPDDLEASEAMTS